MEKRMRPSRSILVLVMIMILAAILLPSLVTANQSPIAVAMPEEQTIYAGEEAWFTAEESRDPDSDPITFSWDFGDGMSSNETNTTHIYNVPGNYTVNLTVSDGLGGVDSDSVNVTVLELPPDNTTAWIEYLTTDKSEFYVMETIDAYTMVERSTGGSPSIWEGTLILEVFNGSMEVVYYDEQDIVLHEVDQSGVTTFEFNISWAGAYLARASLYDNASEFIEQKEINITIVEDPQNEFPEAVIELDVQEVQIDETVSFSGHLSHDPDGSIDSYLWEFGDGNSGSEVNVTHAYLSPGQYTITLTVWDDVGATDSSSVELRVVHPANEPPFAIAKISSQNVKVGEEVLFFGNQSYDPDGSITSYSWDLGDGNVVDGVNVSHIYDSPGSYTVNLTVTDNGFAESMDTVSIEVVEPEVVRTDNDQDLGWSPSFGDVMIMGFFGVLSLMIITFLTEAGRYRLLGLLIPLYTKLKKEEILDDFTRGKIYGYIMANPGDHYNSIKKALKLSDGSFAHHIHVLEKEGVVKSKRDGTHRRFYPSEMRIPENGGTLKKSQLHIIQIVKEAPGISQKDIATLLGVSSATVNYHLKELIKQDIVRAERAGMRMKYFVNPEKMEAASGEDVKKVVDAG
jgi:PKD repeat protein